MRLPAILPVITLLVALQGCAYHTPGPKFTEATGEHDPTIAKLVVTVYGIGDDQEGLIGGRINLGLFNDSSNWLTADDIPFVRVVPTLGHVDTLSITIDEVPVGIWAISLYHDLNENNQLERGALGLPAEPWGMSNNALGTMGPANFEQASFEVRSPETRVEIGLWDGLILRDRPEGMP